jgi:hypothetical protein
LLRTGKSIDCILSEIIKSDGNMLAA